MSQTKAQLVAPVGVVTATAMTITGILTATTLDGIATGVAASIAQGKNLNVGVVTASGISGDIAGSATSITQGNNVTFGSLTGTFVGDLTGNAVGNVTGDAVSATVIGITTSNNVSIGVITATNFIGEGSNLSGAGPQPVSQQSVTADGATTAIDLSSGNLIYMSQSANTTVSFANTSKNNIVYIVRVKDATDTARTITWTDRINWDGGSAPTLLNTNDTDEAQIFELITRDDGVTWYGKEVYKNIGSGYDVFSWGGDSYGAGGTNASVETSSPVQVGSSGAAWKTVYMSADGSHNNFFGKLDNTLWSAGYNSDGNLAQNYTSPNRLSSPVQIPGTWSTNAVLSRFTMLAPKTDGTLWVWGKSQEGSLGLNQGPSQLETLSSPTQIPGTTWSKTTGGGGVMQAIKTDGTLWSWGVNEGGEGGRNDTVRRSSPTQVGTDTTWSKLSVSTAAAGNMGGAIKTNGTLWVWGNQYFSGCLGLNQTGATSYRSSPTQLGTGTDWANVASGAKASMATKTDGTLWVCGDNERGALGQNDLTLRSSPVQIPGSWDLSNFRLTSNSESMMAMKQDGTLWSWGKGGGNLGLNTYNIHYSSPTQVAGTWHQLGGGTVTSASKA